MLRPATTAILLMSSVLLLGPSVEAAPAPAPGFKLARAVKSHLKDLKHDLRDADGALADAVKDLAERVRTGTTDGVAAHAELASLFADHHDALGDALGEAARAIEAELGTALSLLPGDGLPRGFAVGDGGLVDKAMAKADRLLRRSERKARRGLRKVEKALQKTTGSELVADRRLPVAPPIAPAPATASEPATPLLIDVLLSCSEPGVAGTGRLVVTGTADPGAGGMLEVSVERPGAVPLVATVPVDAETGRWKATFPGEGEPGLPAGNYEIDATMADVTFSDSLGIR